MRTARLFGTLEYVWCAWRRRDLFWGAAAATVEAKSGFDMKVRAFASKKSSLVVEWKVRMMAALVWITFILFLQASWVKGVKGQCEQRAALSRILENNEPQALVLPAGDEANSFISTQIRVR